MNVESSVCWRTSWRYPLVINARPGTPMLYNTSYVSCELLVCLLNLLLGVRSHLFFSMKCCPVRKSCNAVSNEHIFACLFELCLVLVWMYLLSALFFCFVGINEMFEIDIFSYECILCPDAFARVYARYDPGYALLRGVSPKQETWNVLTVWEHGFLYLAGDLWHASSLRASL
jgi:hypothetical protein